MSATCPNFNASYCEAHDYDHVFERNEGRFVSAPSAGEGDGAATVRREAIHAFRGLLIAEASDLGLQNIPERIDVPARDGGFRRFFLTATDRDERENEVTGWRYSSRELTLLVVND